MAIELLPVVRAADLERELPDARWLIESLWLKNAQGIVGGGPKLGKSWLGLDFAVSVASGTPCLGHFPVHDPGPALVYLAEDTLPSVRSRIESICDARRVDMGSLDLHVVTVPVLRLDQEADRLRFDATLSRYRPRLVLLDPLVRIHRLDENSATEVSGLLGWLTEIARRHACALVLAHHTSKKHHARPGQALRGSGDLHAWGCSNAYLNQEGDSLTLTLEHRAAPAPDPVRIRLVSRKDGSGTHLQVVGRPTDGGPVPLERRIESLLDDQVGPLRRNELRDRLRVNNHRLGLALDHLEQAGRARRTADGWQKMKPEPAPPTTSTVGIDGQASLFQA